MKSFSNIFTVAFVFLAGALWNVDDVAAQSNAWAMYGTNGNMTILMNASDGSGALAGGNIYWDGSGNWVMKGTLFAATNSVTNVLINGTNGLPGQVLVQTASGPVMEYFWQLPNTNASGASPLFSGSGAPNNGVTLTNYQATNVVNTTTASDGDFTATSTTNIYYMGGTNQLVGLTNLIPGSLYTFIVANYNGSAVLTNQNSVFGFPGFGTFTNSLALGPLGSPSNMITIIVSPSGTNYNAWP